MELRCIRCGTPTTLWHCPVHGPEVRVDVIWPEERVQALAAALPGRSERGCWRYRELLPVALPPSLRLPETPLVHAPRLAEWLGVESVVLKDDGLMPSGSTKDRASVVGVAMALERGAERIVCASTGNAAASTACQAARVGLPATIFVPRRAPVGKVAQLQLFGAQVLRIDADYDTTWELCNRLAGRRPDWYNRNCAQNPWLVEGKKSAGLEFADQLDAVPDWLAISVGDGCSVAGFCKGLLQAHQAGLIPRLPRVLAVQAAGAAPLVAAAAGGSPVMQGADTVADSLCVGHPRNPDKALEYVRRVEGRWVAVSDEAILEALVMCPRLSGVFGEPAAATTVAGVREAAAQGWLKGSVGILITGNGLKDPAPALERAGQPMDLPADMEAIEAALA